MCTHRFEFGFGLSYSTFRFEWSEPPAAARSTLAIAAAGDGRPALVFRVNVTNTGGSKPNWIHTQSSPNNNPNDNLDQSSKSNSPTLTLTSTLTLAPNPNPPSNPNLTPI